MSKYYTLIGSRETPPDILELMSRAAEGLAANGWIGRSGGADGADTSLEQGVDEFCYNSGLDSTHYGTYMEVYLPWKDFNGRVSSASGYFTLPYMDNKDEAGVVAESIHPAWGRCSQGAQKLHTRNIYQLLGQNLTTPSRFVLCYTQPTSKGSVTVKGGTGTAVKLGLDNGVEIINLYYKENVERIKTWLKL